MDIAVVGGGGREHALIEKILESPRCGRLVAIPGNGSIAGIVPCVPIAATDVNAIAEYCADEQIDYVVVAPDDPLALGLVDLLAERGIPAFGPTKAAARIESSKAFAKDLMAQYHIPTAQYRVFADYDAAVRVLDEQNRYPVVVKADGLALGKGVLICANRAEAVAALDDMLCRGRFGASGARVVLEEFLTGPEVSVLAFCDGETVAPMASAMDHKRAHDGDTGENTGGMGAVAPNPHYTEAVAACCMRDIFAPTVAAMRAAGAPFKGCLYFGLMLTPDGPKVIEYNCRFGDPETQAVLPLLEGDLLEWMLACTEGRLGDTPVTSSDKSCCCVVVASGGYPGAYENGFEIDGIEDAQRSGAQVYGAGVALKDDALVTAGGRVLDVAATADTLPEAIERAYAATAKIKFTGAFYRGDIGKNALGAKTGDR